jgi:hypothetical protein
MPWVWSNNRAYDAEPVDASTLRILDEVVRRELRPLEVPQPAASKPECPRQDRESRSTRVRRRCARRDADGSPSISACGR